MNTPPVKRHFLSACSALGIDPARFMEERNCRHRESVRDREAVWMWMRTHDIPNLLRPPSYPEIAQETSQKPLAHSTVISAIRRVIMRMPESERAAAWKSVRGESIRSGRRPAKEPLVEGALRGKADGWDVGRVYAIRETA